MTTNGTGARIELLGVREAGLDGIDVRLPLRRLVCLAGATGSGARALAERVLLGESRRRYLLSLTPFERERIGGIGTQAAVDGILGLPPAQPLPAPFGGAATVASRLHLPADMARVLRASSRVSCEHCNGSCIAFHEEDVQDLVELRFAGESVLVVAPMALEPEAVEGVLGELERAGFLRLRIDGQVRRLDAPEEGATWTTDGLLQVVVDRLSPSGRTRSRLGEAVRTARAIAAGRTLLVGETDQVWIDSRRACVDCGRPSDEPDWDRLVRGESIGTSVELHGSDDMVAMAGLRLRDLVGGVLDQTESGEGRRLRRAGEICQELSLGALPLWRSLTDLAHGEQLLLDIAATRVTGLTGVLHVVLSPPSALDEATSRLVQKGLRMLVDEGASVVVVDGDTSTAAWADEVVGLGTAGPADALLAGVGPAPVDGGIEDLIVAPAAENEVPVPAARIVVPLNRLVVVTGSSGTGKTRLLQLIAAQLSGKRSALRRVEAPAVRRVIEVTDDESKSRQEGSGLADLMGLPRALARLFADAPVAREAGLGTDHFLLQKPGGRCEGCQGLGLIRHRLDLVEDVEVVCARCRGRRFRDEILAVTAHGLSIAEAYSMTVTEAGAHFGRERAISQLLKLASRCGLGRRPLDTVSADLDPVERLLARLTRHQAGVRHGDLVLVDRPVAGCDEVAVVHVINTLHRLVALGASVLITDAPGRLARHADAIVSLDASFS